MRILVVGGGGREHALCWALARDAAAGDRLYAAPGNPGTASLATNLPIAATAVDEIVRVVADHDIDVTIVGPEAPLALGLADRLRATGRAVFGPGAAAARLESSKAFAKEVMGAAGVRTAANRVFTELAPALAHIATHVEPLVVKASGLAGGKGAIVCETRDEAAEAARSLLEGKLGDAGRRILIEHFLVGEELSVLALTDGERTLLLPPAQDHKRLSDGDQGPNTGGMGAYAPVSLVTPVLLARVRREILEPTLRELARRGTPYQGVLYAGLMVGADGTPSVVEFNCRFGDPEAQALLPILPRGATRHLAAIATGHWDPHEDLLAPVNAAVTTVLAARGYPDRPEPGAPITLPADADLGDDILVFHAATARDADGTLRVNGGRVLNVTAVAPTVAAAARRSREAAERIEFAGKTWRRDIGWRELARAGAA